MAPAQAPEHPDQASRYLSETRDAFTESAAGLSPAQMNFKPNPERWSIAEIIEHVVVVENRIHHVIGNIGTGPAPAGPDQLKQDDFVVTRIPDRTSRVQAPPPVQPTGRWTGEEGLKLFLEARAKTLTLVSTPSLRDHIFAHPLFGPWDGYQWLLGAASHSARHTGQIGEVKADPGFPQS